MSERPVYRRSSVMTDRPSHYCPGCGHGLAHKLVAETIEQLGIRDRTIGVSPVGCSVLAYFYIDVDMAESAHGRTPAMATGIKRALPDRIVFAYQGDGDLAAIGMAETVHAANRGEPITVVFINNAVYGMTGGQMAPTTLVGQVTATTPEGRNPELCGPPIRICELLNTLDRPYHIERVALDGPDGVRRARRAILAAFKAQVEHNRYGFVELLAACPTHQRLSPKDALAFVGGAMSEAFPPRLFRKDGRIVDA